MKLKQTHKDYHTRKNYHINIKQKSAKLRVVYSTRLPLMGFDTRETREGWPLLTVETEVNVDSKSSNERSPSLVGSLGLSCRYKRLLSCLGCSVQLSRNIFLLNLCVYIGPHRPATWAGSRAGPPVSEYVSVAETAMVGLFNTKTVPTTNIQ